MTGEEAYPRLHSVCGSRLIETRSLLLNHVQQDRLAGPVKTEKASQKASHYQGKRRGNPTSRNSITMLGPRKQSFAHDYYSPANAIPGRTSLSLETALL
jgi:hypothetical protein